MVPYVNGLQYFENLEENSLSETRMITTDEGHAYITGTVEAITEWILNFN